AAPPGPHPRAIAALVREFPGAALRRPGEAHHRRGLCPRRPQSIAHRQAAGHFTQRGAHAAQAPWLPGLETGALSWQLSLKRKVRVSTRSERDRAVQVLHSKKSIGEERSGRL